MIKNLKTIFYIFLYLGIVFLQLYLVNIYIYIFITCVINLLKIINYLYLDLELF